MKSYSKTITLILMGMFIYFSTTWVQPLHADLGLKFYLLIGFLGAGSYGIAEALVNAAISTKQMLDGAKA